MRIRKATMADAAGIAKVHLDSWRTTYRGIVPDSYLDAMSYEERTKRWETNLKANPIVYVAEDESGEIVGFANGGKERSGHPVYTGELYAIYILAACQRQGIGRQLVDAIVESLAQAGFRSMLIWVLEDNPSKYFYEALGGKKAGNQPIEIGGAVLQEIAYGWDNIMNGRE